MALVFEKQFSKEFRWKPTRLYNGMGWQTDFFDFGREADITLFVGARTRIDQQFGIDGFLPSLPPEGAAVRRWGVSVSYLCMIPRVSHIQYTLTVTMAKPTGFDEGNPLTRPLKRVPEASILLFDRPDFGGTAHQVCGGQAGMNGPGVMLGQMRSFIVASGSWAFFRDSAFQGAYTASPRSRSPILVPPGHYPSLIDAGIDGWIGSLIGT